MADNDTIRLLRECDAGVKMGIASISDVLDRVQNHNLRQILTENKAEHEKLDREITSQLQQYHDKGKSPNPMAQSMSWLKTNVKLMMDGSDNEIANLMTDGCGMGIKSLNRYRNQYKAADPAAGEMARRLIGLEENLVQNLRQYL